MATIRKLQRQTGVVYKAIIKDRFGKPIKSKILPKKSDARIWADRVESNQGTIDAYGNKGSKMTFAELVDEYILQWHGKDIIHQQSCAFYWVEQFAPYLLSEINADKIRAALSTLRSGKGRRGNGRGKTAGVTKALRRHAPKPRLTAILNYAFKQGDIVSGLHHILHSKCDQDTGISRGD